MATVLKAFAGGRLFGVAAGDVGDARILALHGWQRDHRDWVPVLDGLPYVTLDLPGFGASPPPPDAWGSARYARAVAEVLDEIGTPVVVAGHSFGGRVAVQLAAAEPDRIAGLVLTGVPGLSTVEGRRPAKAALPFRVGRALHRAGLVGDQRMERLRRRYGSADYRAASGVMRAVLVKVVNERYDAVLAGVGCPIELVWGADDSAAPVAAAQAAAARLAHAALEVVDGAGHFTLDTIPDRVRAAVERRLADLPPATGGDR